jgi:hypothetical protein
MHGQTALGYDAEPVVWTWTIVQICSIRSLGWIQGLGTNPAARGPPKRGNLTNKQAIDCHFISESQAKVLPSLEMK